MEELDSLVRKVIELEIPSGFADRVMTKIGEEESKGESFSSQWFPLLKRIFYSRAVQWMLVGIGTVFGLYKIFSLFSGLMLHAFV
ncbi:MAG: hypothetical protein OEY25_02650 [Candidatus Aminicenantes bacterium]|nr:hypothetical protein [Candidatus Aminicenantes bacterium]